MPRRKKPTKSQAWWQKSLRWIRNAIFYFVLFSIGITLLLRWINVPFTSFMISQTFVTPHTIHKINWIPIEQVSPNLLIAVVAAEDQKFPNHYGFDLKAIQTAIKDNKNNTRIRGGSTITQQVAKNVFLWPQKSFLRKGLEAYFAVLIEMLWPKWRILEVYVNVAEMAPYTFGAQNASRVHFGKSAFSLNSYEAALLAAGLPNPRRLRASHPSDYVQRRATQINEQVELLGGSSYLQPIW